MQTTTYLRWSTLLTLGGTIFSGYTACYAAFALFASMLMLSAVSWIWEVRGGGPMLANAIVAGAGVLLAGSLTVGDVFALAGGARYQPLPGCAYGMIFFAAELILSMVALLKRPHPPGTRWRPRMA